MLELVYDGDCGLCRASAQWVSRRDRQHRIVCTPSADCTWDDAAQQPFVSTVVVRYRGATYTASTAVAVALIALPWPWGVLGAWVRFLNRSRLLRGYHDACYYAVARHRLSISRLLVRLRLIDESCSIVSK